MKTLLKEIKYGFSIISLFEQQYIQDAKQSIDGYEALLNRFQQETSPIPAAQFMIINNLSEIYYMYGDIPKAISLLTDYQKNHTPRLSFNATLLCNLAALHGAIGDLNAFSQAKTQLENLDLSTRRWFQDNTNMVILEGKVKWGLKAQIEFFLKNLKALELFLKEEYQHPDCLGFCLKIIETAPKLAPVHGTLDKLAKIYAHTEERQKELACLQILASFPYDWHVVEQAKAALQSVPSHELESIGDPFNLLPFKKNINRFPISSSGEPSKPAPNVSIWESILLAAVIGLFISIANNILFTLPSPGWWLWSSLGLLGLLVTFIRNHTVWLWVLSITCLLTVGTLLYSILG